MAKMKKRAEARCRYHIRKLSAKKGWDTSHPSRGGEFLEEQEITDYLPNTALGLDRPDFVVVQGGMPTVVIEAKNSIDKLEQAVTEAIDYAEQINNSGNYDVRVAVGAAGEESHGFGIEVWFRNKGKWEPLKSNGYELTAVPTRREVDRAILEDNGTTTVDVPDASEFIDSAIELSRILRSARVEAPLRPKVIGSLTLALYQGDIELSTGDPLQKINSLIASAVDLQMKFSDDKKQRLIESLALMGADYERLTPHIAKIVHLLRGLNIRAVLHTGTDFLGLFYEAFLRYGYDNNALGIVFTPRHITEFCVDILQPRPRDKVVDLTCGTGGFLVAAFEQMMEKADGPAEVNKVKRSLYGYDTNPTIWALATLNMFFRGDEESRIENKSCLDDKSREAYADQFDIAFLNPPFSQDDEPEREFIDASMEALEPGGRLAAVVKAGVFADDDNSHWRKEFLRKHSIKAMISLPDDLFYPTAAPTTILIASAHQPQKKDSNILMSRISNDGYKKLKGRRVQTIGSQLPAVLEDAKNLIDGIDRCSPNSVTIKANKIFGGEEWSPQQWLPQPHESESKMSALMSESKMLIFRSVAAFPDLASVTLPNFGHSWSKLPELPTMKAGKIEEFFEVHGGKSKGEKNYTEGDTPYVSSGDGTNSIIRLVTPPENEVFGEGGITVTAFGQAAVQPWPFIARGNGGSAVRVLIPKFSMSYSELIWFAAQINSQRWRFFYGRMAIKARLSRLEVESPDSSIQTFEPIKGAIDVFKDTLIKLSEK